MNQMTEKIGLIDALMNTGVRIIKFVPEPKPEPPEPKPEPEPKEKCVISVVDMWSEKEKTGDKVNFYIYDDKEKFGDKIWKGDDEDEEHTVKIEPIGSTNYCYPGASYIAFGSLLFRVGGHYLTHSERENRLAVSNHLIHRATRTVDIIDLESGEDLMTGATKGPEMNYPRLEPHLLILQGNLYVAGGFYDMIDMDILFMEVLNQSAASIDDWFWEPLPNPPELPGHELPYITSVTGAVESEGVIVVGFQGMEGFFFYAYQTTTRTWTTYTYIDLVGHNIGILYRRPAVMSGKLMLWLPEFCTVLQAMDLENNKHYAIDLSEKELLPSITRIGDDSPHLLKLDEGKFCVFWADDEYGTDFHASTFTLKAHNGTLHVKLIKRHFSLITAWGCLMEVCIADFPDAKRRNKTWTPFC